MQNEKKGNTFTKKIGNATYHVQIYFNKCTAARKHEWVVIPYA